MSNLSQPGCEATAAESPFDVIQARLEAANQCQLDTLDVFARIDVQLNGERPEKDNSVGCDAPVGPGRLGRLQYLGDRLQDQGQQIERLTRIVLSTI